MSETLDNNRHDLLPICVLGDVVVWMVNLRRPASATGETIEDDRAHQGHAHILMPSRQRSQDTVRRAFRLDGMGEAREDAFDEVNPAQIRHGLRIPEVVVNAYRVRIDRRGGSSCGSKASPEIEPRNVAGRSTTGRPGLWTGFGVRGSSGRWSFRLWRSWFA